MDLTIVFHYVTGLLLAYAYDDLSYNKQATQSHTFIGTDYAAGNAVDRNTTTCTRTQGIGQNSPDKTVWWKVDLGGVYSIYSVNVLFRNYNGWSEDRQRGRFAGFSLYVSKTGDIQGSIMCYKDGPQLPPLNFTTICKEYGRYVIFYNERIDGFTYPEGYEIYNVYTELCEVIIQGCNKPGMYGNICDSLCPINCKDNTCHIENGTCFGCELGWKGTSCDIKCREGWYGVNCSHQCVGHCRDNTTCNHVTGQCTRGCTAGWTGSLCVKICDDGTYGYDCMNNCSGHCLNNSPCNKQTGHCDRGCNPGYTNTDCSKECSPGYFGLDCRELCRSYCIHHEECNHVSGYCLRGCMDGYIGQHCNNSCQHGYHGKNCSKACSSNCKTCRHTDGLCSCKAGWTGHNCSIECTGAYGENCQYPCSIHCMNQTCNKFNGSCLYDEKHDSLRNVETKDVPSCTVWIVVASLSLLINIMSISATLISRRKTLLKQKSTTDKVNFPWRSDINTDQTATTDDPSHYQELSNFKDENAYQSLKQQ